MLDFSFMLLVYGVEVYKTYYFRERVFISYFSLIRNMLGKILVADILKYFFFFSSENRVCYGENTLHKMSNPVF